MCFACVLRVNLLFVLRVNVQMLYCACQKYECCLAHIVWLVIGHMYYTCTYMGCNSCTVRQLFDYYVVTT